MSVWGPPVNGCNTLKEMIVTTTGKWYFRTRTTTDMMRVPVIQRGHRGVDVPVGYTAWCGLCGSCVMMAVPNIQRCHTGKTMTVEHSPIPCDKENLVGVGAMVGFIGLIYNSENLLFLVHASIPFSKSININGHLRYALRVVRKRFS